MRNRWESEVIYELVDSVSHIFAIKITYEIIFQAHSVLWELWRSCRTFCGYLARFGHAGSLSTVFQLWGQPTNSAITFPEVAGLQTRELGGRDSRSVKYSRSRPAPGAQRRFKDPRAHDELSPLLMFLPCPLFPGGRINQPIGSPSIGYTAASMPTWPWEMFLLS